MRRVIGDTKARVSTTNTQSIATLLSFTNMKEYAMHYWVEIIIKKFWPVSWVEDEYIQSVIKHPSSANVSTKTVKNILFVLEEMVVEKIQSILVVKLELLSMMDGSLMVFTFLDFLHLMNSKKVTIYQKLKLISYQHPCIFFKW